MFDGDRQSEGECVRGPETEIDILRHREWEYRVPLSWPPTGSAEISLSVLFCSASHSQHGTLHDEDSFRIAVTFSIEQPLFQQVCW